MLPATLPRTLARAARLALLSIVAALSVPAAMAEEIPQPTVATAASMADVVAGPAQRSEAGARTRLRLDATAPSVEHAGYLTYYRTYEVVAPRDGPLSVTLESFCACVGFDKKMAVPVALVVDASGAPVELPDLARVDPGFGIAKIRGHFAARQGQAYRVVVMADNSSPGSTVHTINIGTTTSSNVMSLPTRSVPGAKMRLTIGGKK